LLTAFLPSFSAWVFFLSISSFLLPLLCFLQQLLLFSFGFCFLHFSQPVFFLVQRRQEHGWDAGEGNDAAEVAGHWQRGTIDGAARVLGRAREQLGFLWIWVFFFFSFSFSFFSRASPLLQFCFFLFSICSSSYED
jgi:hypothetical protein